LGKYKFNVIRELFNRNIALFLAQDIHSTSRIKDYEALSNRLNFQSAVYLRSLTSKQVFHFTLRCILWRSGYIPWNYARFLDYASDRIFLQKVGGGYVFIHRLLLEHFARMKPTRVQN
jgi:hypothetical protein